MLVVEDDSSLRVTLADNLGDEGYAVTAVGTLAAARAAAGAFEVIVLDVMLPDGDGVSYCRELRAAGVASRVLLLTARSLEDDVVNGLGAGADDYVAKPYRLRELLARIAALSRRGASPSTKLGAYEVDMSTRTVRGPEGEVAVTRKEFDLLAYLLGRGDAVASREEILEAVWGDVVVDPHTVDNFMGALKKKLKSGGFEVKTVRGVGFRLIR